MNTPLSKGLGADGIGVGVLIAVTAAAYFGGVRPLLAARERRADLVEHLAHEAKETGRLADEATRIAAETALLQQQLAESAVQLQNAGKINDRLDQLAPIAGASGVRIDLMQPGPASYKERFGTLPITLRGSGSYAAAAGLLRGLHGAFRDMGVDSFEVAGDPALPGAEPTFTMGLVWYVLPGAGAPAGAAPRASAEK